MVNTQKFVPDELLIWHNSEGGSITQRQVAFRSQKGNRALVAWGHTSEGDSRLYDVPLSALTRPEPAQNRAPIYHERPFTTPKAPTPPSDDQLKQQLTTRQEALAEAHAAAARAKEAVSYASELVNRARREHSNAEAALRTLTQHENAEKLRLEEAIRNNLPAPEPVPSGQDKAYVQARVDSTAAIVNKLSAEHQAAVSRLSQVSVTVSNAATGVIACLFEMDCERLRSAELEVMQFRANLLQISQWWPNNKMLPISEAAGNILTNHFDVDRLKFMGQSDAAGPWKTLLKKLINDPAAALEPVTEAEAA